MKNKRMTRLCIAVFASLFTVTNAFAIEEAEVESAIAATSKEAVSGNILIWLLCAVAFLKVSMKIDELLISLGINVGRSGSSMLSELMVVGKALGAAAGMAGGALGHMFSHGGKPAGAAAGQAFTADGGGLGAAARCAAGNMAADSVTGHGGAVSSFLGGAMLGSSLNRTGRFASDVIGAVAKGNIGSVGSITGEKASQALTSYLGYDSSMGNAVSSDMASGVDSVTAQPGEDSITIDGGRSAFAGAGPIGPGTDTGAGVAKEAPAFRDVEIGGGRITGFETPAGGGEERQFAMYNAQQYMTPSGEYETVQTTDGESWYKQYAQPSVTRTPYKSGDKIKYTESIVAEMPQIPKRKDRV